MRTCKIPECNRRHSARGWCRLHYGRWQRQGDPTINKNWKGGIRSHPMYGAWHQMINRCHNPANSSYGRYGARGIYVCDRWRNDFRNFLTDMGERPQGKTLDRIDSYGPYSPQNCRWASLKDQRANMTAEGRERAARATSKAVRAYWEEWRKHNTLKPKHLPASPKKRVCRQCGVTFMQDPPIGQPRKYCSDTCRSAYYLNREAAGALG